jgi:hypothetical protein
LKYCRVHNTCTEDQTMPFAPFASALHSSCMRQVVSHFALAIPGNGRPGPFCSSAQVVRDGPDFRTQPGEPGKLSRSMQPVTFKCVNFNLHLSKESTSDSPGLSRDLLTLFLQERHHYIGKPYCPPLPSCLVSRFGGLHLYFNFI